MPSFVGGVLLSPYKWLLGLTLAHQSGRTPLVPLYALLLFNVPSELTLRTLYEFDELGGNRAYPMI